MSVVDGCVDVVDEGYGRPIPIVFIAFRSVVSVPYISKQRPRDQFSKKKKEAGRISSGFF